MNNIKTKEKGVKMQFNKEKAEKNLNEIIAKMQNNTDTTLLHEYYKLFKKEISFFKRSWAAAWLFMYYDGKEIPSAKTSPAKNITQNKKNIKSSSDSTEKTLPPPMMEEESKRLFFSIGKNRRLFPREVINLIMSKTTAVREDIGLIRILDNYSFVQVRDNKADEIIKSLTGIKFRGRPLTVNYAKAKTDDSDNE